MNSVELLKTLSDPFGPSGFEDAVREVIQPIVEPLVDEVRVDALGNLIAIKRGNGSSERTLMIDAHMDEIGFIVTYVEEGGFIRFTQISGWDVRIIPSHVMTIRADDGTLVRGMIGTPPPHILRPEDREKPYKLEDLFIDIGVSSADEVAALGIHTGSPAVIAYPFEQLNDRVIMGRALDDRAGCAVLVRVLEALRDEQLDVTLAATFSVQEEVGLRGAGTAAFSINPDIGIALETTVAGDVPGVHASRVPSRQGKGPTVSVHDNSMVASPRAVKALTSIAAEESIPFQYKIPGFGGTDAGAIHRTRGGVITGVISMPCRYIHSPYAILRLEDFENAVKLTTAFARRCPGAVGL